ncbi:WD40/YVTN/BNR-like repeat-containing protein [Fangia hongkongensis]|uniref:WD40/YVTN/BNR-like repeat-containing protein n=1 Tax=Fangia hongkongensis TaxID=270495 RepID=UPI00036F3AA2|nr:sialidase family protein [Fangia hongkongensis]MBK2124861.1 exo-alpha-sialidase [Fangia hongkongensis]
MIKYAIFLAAVSVMPAYAHYTSCDDFIKVDGVGKNGSANAFIMASKDRKCYISKQVDVSTSEVTIHNSVTTAPDIELVSITAGESETSPSVLTDKAYSFGQAGEPAIYALDPQGDPLHLPYSFSSDFGATLTFKFIATAQIQAGAAYDTASEAGYYLISSVLLPRFYLHFRAKNKDKSYSYFTIEAQGRVIDTNGDGYDNAGVLPRFYCQPPTGDASMGSKNENSGWENMYFGCLSDTQNPAYGKWKYYPYIKYGDDGLRVPGQDTKGLASLEFQYTYSFIPSSKDKDKKDDPVQTLAYYYDKDKLCTPSKDAKCAVTDAKNNKLYLSSNIEKLTNVHLTISDENAGGTYPVFQLDNYSSYDLTNINFNALLKPNGLEFTKDDKLFDATTPSKWPRITTQNGISSNHIYALYSPASTKGVILAATEKGLMVSSDYGENWKNYTPKNDGIATSQVVSVVQANKHIYALVHSLQNTYALYQVNVDTHQWHLIKSDFLSLFEQPKIYVYKNEMLVSNYLNNGYFSNDGGHSWSKLEIAGDIGMSSSIIAPDGTLIAGGFDNNQVSAIYRSKDGGKNWQKISGTDNTGSGLSGDFASFSIHNYISTQKYIYAGTGNGKLFISYDNGQSWQKVNTLNSVSDNLLNGLRDNGDYVGAADMIGNTGYLIPAVQGNFTPTLTQGMDFANIARTAKGTEISSVKDAASNYYITSVESMPDSVSATGIFWSNDSVLSAKAKASEDYIVNAIDRKKIFLGTLKSGLLTHDGIDSSVPSGDSTHAVLHFDFSIKNFENTQNTFDVVTSEGSNVNVPMKLKISVDDNKVDCAVINTKTQVSSKLVHCQATSTKTGISIIILNGG